MPGTARRDDLREGAHRVLPAFAVSIAMCVAVASVLGLLLTHAFEHSWLVDLDQRIEHGLVEHRTAFFDRATGWATLPADPVPVALVWAASMVVVRLVLHRWRHVLLVFFAVAGEKCSYFFTTLVVRRPRPDVPTIGTRHVTSSFPSGHVGSAISLYGAIALLLVAHATRTERGRRIAIAISVAAVSAIATVVAMSRMYRGFHFLTDVLVGACIGVGWLVIATRIVRRLHPDADTSQPTPT